MRIFLPSVVQKTVTTHCFNHNNINPHLKCKLKFINSTDFIDSHRLLQTMCQGHEDAASTRIQSTNVPPPPSSSGHESQSDGKRKQKLKNKQHKQQLVKEHTPPSTPPPPTHELVKSGSTKLANGKRYVDVRSAFHFSDIRHIVTHL
jgi:hypothetical protein